MRRTVSVITPSFNQGRFIEETINSVISQEGDFFLEYLIMDGGSTDNTVEIIRKYEKLLAEKKYPIRCKGIEFRWVSEKDKGQTDAVNKGFKAAKGDFLGWLNSDDTYMPGAIDKAVGFFEKNNDVLMVYGQGNHIAEGGQLMDRYPTEPFSRERLLETCFICQPTVFLRRSVLDEVGFLDESLHYCMDYEYWLRVSRKKKVGFLDEYLANTRLYADTKTMSKRFEVHREIVYMLKRHHGYVPNSWLYAYTQLAVERIVRQEGYKKLLFKALWAAFFLLKSIQINKKLPSIPVQDIRVFLGK
ncbi:MAG: glycosyltransferase [Deltaproteobacteria bacterium]|nr:glycosyltransferase [Deltaproteobacteria bacterium]